MTEQTFTLERGPRDMAGLIRYLMRLDVKKAWRISIGPVKKERSDLQNKALWGCAYEYIHKATGNDKDDLHVYFCGEYFGWKESRVMGRRKIKPIRSTTKDERGKRDVISTKDLSDFYDFIQRRAAEGTPSVYVPDPDPNWWRSARRVA